MQWLDDWRQRWQLWRIKDPIIRATIEAGGRVEIVREGGISRVVHHRPPSPGEDLLTRIQRGEPETMALMRERIDRDLPDFPLVMAQLPPGASVPMYRALAQVLVKLDEATPEELAEVRNWLNEPEQDTSQFAAFVESLRPLQA